MQFGTVRFPTLYSIYQEHSTPDIKPSQPTLPRMGTRSRVQSFPSDQEELNPLRRYSEARVSSPDSVGWSLGPRIRLPMCSSPLGHKGPGAMGVIGLLHRVHTGLPKQILSKFFYLFYLYLPLLPLLPLLPFIPFLPFYTFLYLTHTLSNFYLY